MSAPEGLSIAEDQSLSLDMVESISEAFNSEAFVDEHGKPCNQEKALHDETIKNYSLRAASGEDIDAGFRLSGAAAAGKTTAQERKSSKKNGEFVTTLMRLQQLQTRIAQSKARLVQIDQQLSQVQQILMLQQRELEEGREEWDRRSANLVEDKRLSNDDSNDQEFDVEEARKILEKRGIEIPEGASKHDMFRIYSDYIENETKWVKQRALGLGKLKDDIERTKKEEARLQAERQKEQEHLKSLEQDVEQIQSAEFESQEARQEAELEQTKKYTNKTVEQFNENSRDLVWDDRLSESTQDNKRAQNLSSDFSI